MRVPCSQDAVTQIQEDEFMDYELQSFWGRISGDPNCEPEDRVSTQIHNPAIRYFHMILAHTIFAKPEPDTSVSKQELFIMFCAFQGRPVNIATFMLANFDKISNNMNRSVNMGGFVTFLAKKIGLQTRLDQIVPFGTPYASGFRYMDVTFCFNHHLIGNLGPGPYQLLVNHTPVHDLTLPNPDRTNLHDKKNWLYDLEEEDENDPETPPFYYTPGALSPIHPAESTTPPLVDHTNAIANLETKLETLREDFTNFMNLFIQQSENFSNELAAFKRAFNRSG
jgi:hypothetical protein